jgi:hypothetical protein
MEMRELPSALRVHTRLIEKKSRTRSKYATSENSVKVGEASTENHYWRTDWPELVLTFSLVRQAGIFSPILKYGVYQVYFFDQLLSEAVFISPQLDDQEMEMVKEEAEHCGLHTVTLQHFVNVLMLVGYRYNGLITAFNLASDLPYLACGFDYPKRGYFKGGFILRFREYERDGMVKACLFTPKVAIKQVSKGVIIAWRKPEHKARRHDALNRKYGGGEFLDLQTFVYALTDAECTFDEACTLFKIDIPQSETSELAKCRQEAYQSFRLYHALIDEYSNHPVPTSPNRLYSPASLGKAYFKAMGIRSPELLIDPDLNLSTDQVHGLAMSAYHAGRCELRLRRVEVPVAYLDFKQMYPTVNVLMGLWDTVTARSVLVEDATAQVIEIINRIKPDDVFDQSLWKELNTIALVEFDGDFLPGRFQFSQQHQYYSLAWGILHPGADYSTHQRWYALADLIASKIVTSKAPHIVKALRFTLSGRQAGLHSTVIRGKVAVDPYHDDFFKALVEERQRIKANLEIEEREKYWIAQSLKLTVNVDSYGLYPELNPDPDKAEADVIVYADRVFRSKATFFENPGQFYFPIISTLVTAGAHLMLALLHYKVEQAGGRLVFEDTDGAALAASDTRHVLEYRDHRGQVVTIPLLSMEAVDEILRTFESLNPYDKKAVHGSILRREKENYPPEGQVAAYDLSTGECSEIPAPHLEEDTELLCYAIAPKRYCLYNKAGRQIILRKGSESGLGQWLSPIDADNNGRWIEYFWLWTVSGGLLDEESSGNIYAGKPLISAFPVSTSGIMRGVQPLNAASRLPYHAGIKPFDRLMHPVRDDLRLTDEPDDVFLIAALKENLTEALEAQYTDLNSPGGMYKISVNGRSLSSVDYDTGEYVEFISTRDQNDYLNYYSKMPAVSMLDRYGELCTRDTIGELFPPVLKVKCNEYIGKEFSMSDWEEVDPWEFADNSYNLYQPDEWETQLLPRLKEIPTYELSRVTDIDQGNLTLYLSGKHRPNEENIEKIRQGLLNVSGQDEWVDKILPRLKKMPTREAARITGLSYRQIQLLKSGKRHTSKDILEKLEREGQQKSITPPVNGVDSLERVHRCG